MPAAASKTQRISGLLDEGLRRWQQPGSLPVENAATHAPFRNVQHFAGAAEFHRRASSTNARVRSASQQPSRFSDFIATTCPLECCSAPKSFRRGDTRFDEGVYTQNSLVQHSLREECDSTSVVVAISLRPKRKTTLEIRNSNYEPSLTP